LGNLLGDIFPNLLPKLTPPSISVGARRLEERDPADVGRPEELEVAGGPRGRPGDYPTKHDFPYQIGTNTSKPQ
jgi:hypothetical protein